jgi:magnesium-transporting ATPase (P-type)
LVHLVSLFSICNLVDTSMIKPRHPDDPFEPNPINSVVYIAGVVIQANIFLVNYRGHPFMTPLSSNKIFVRTLASMYLLAVLLTMGFVPAFVNSTFELVEIDPVRIQVLLYLMLDTVLVVILERVVRDTLKG